MIAQQVAGKATRDALFLSHFPVEALPAIVAASAVVSVVTMAAMIRLLSRYGPGKVVPRAFGFSAASLAAIAGLSMTSGRLAAVLLYLHIGTVGAIIISGFWSVVNERFDPRSARRTIGRIAVGGTLGGLVGGLIAMIAAPRVDFGPVLFGLAGLHVLCVPLVVSLRPKGPDPTEILSNSGALHQVPSGSIFAGLSSVRADPYLRTIALLVITVTATEALIDFVFKAAAASRFGDGASLLQFFAVFYTVVGLLTFAFQALMGRRVLERFGLVPSLVSLPIGVAGAVVGAVAFPGLVAASVTRGMEAVMRSSLYRSGYELLYVPVAAEAKRTAKSLIDVGADRAGNVIGSTLVAGVLALGLAGETRVMLVVAAALACTSVVLVSRLRDGYSSVLEESMINRALALELSGLSDESEFQNTIHLSVGELDVRQVLAGLSDAEPAAAELSSGASEPAPPPAVAENADPLLDTLVALRSREPERVLGVLGGPVGLGLVPHIVPLLAWDEVASAAINALRPHADQAAGQLGDALLSEQADFAIRRRIPRVLAAAKSQRAVELLIEALADSRFEVRFRSAHALREILRATGQLSISREMVLDTVSREVGVDRGVWENHRLINESSTVGALESGAVGSPFMVELVRLKSQRALQHVFTMLSLVYAEEPLQTAYRALHTDDAGLRGTALEYLESILPARIHRQLLPFVEDRPRSPAPARPREEVLRALLQSHKSIQLNLEALRARLGD